MIPPQAKRDQFVLHDLALNALAHLALLDDPSVTASWNLPPDVATCTEYFTRAYESPSFTTQYPPTDLRYLYDPPYTGASSANEYAAARLRVHAQVLRSAGRLLREVIDKSYYGDLAGAENARASVGDPLRGTELMWGVCEGEDGSYDSLRHLLRLLFGRLELGANYAVATQRALETCENRFGAFICSKAGCKCTKASGCTPLADAGATACDCYQATTYTWSCYYDAPLAPPTQAAGQPRQPHQDPKCQGFAALDLLRRESDKTTLLSPGFSARWQDKEVSTTGQQLAYSTLLGAGIVIPPAKYKNSLKPVRDAIEEQLLIEAFNAGRSKNATAVLLTDQEFLDFKGGPAGKAVSDVLAGIADADLVFALDRIFGQSRLLTDSAEGLASVGNVGGARFLLPIVPSPGGPPIVLSPQIVEQGGGCCVARPPTGLVAYSMARVA